MAFFVDVNHIAGLHHTEVLSQSTELVRDGRTRVSCDVRIYPERPWVDWVANTDVATRALGESFPRKNTKGTCHVL